MAAGPGDPWPAAEQNRARRRSPRVRCEQYKALARYGSPGGDDSAPAPPRSARATACSRSSCATRSRSGGTGLEQSRRANASAATNGKTTSEYRPAPKKTACDAAVAATTAAVAGEDERAARERADRASSERHDERHVADPRVQRERGGARDGDDVRARSAAPAAVATRPSDRERGAATARERLERRRATAWPGRERVAGWRRAGTRAPRRRSRTWRRACAGASASQARGARAMSRRALALEAGVLRRLVADLAALGRDLDAATTRRSCVCAPMSRFHPPLTLTSAQRFIRTQLRAVQGATQASAAARRRGAARGALERSARRTASAPKTGARSERLRAHQRRDAHRRRRGRRPAAMRGAQSRAHAATARRTDEQRRGRRPRS